MYRALVLLVLIFISGCWGSEFEMKPSNRYTVYVDPAFGKSTQLIEQGIREWQQMAPATIELNIVHEYFVCPSDEGRCPAVIAIHLVQASSLKPLPWESPDRIIRGRTHFFREWDYSEVLIPLDVGGSFQVIREVVSHEMGHALGLDHETDDQHRLMYPDVTEEGSWHQHVRCHDIEAFARIRGEEILGCTELFPE